MIIIIIIIIRVAEIDIAASRRAEPFEALQSCLKRESNIYDLYKQCLISKGRTSNDMGFVSSVINGDSVDDEDAADSNEVVLLCDVIVVESGRLSMAKARSTFGGMPATRSARSFEGDDEEKMKLRDVSVPDRTA